MSDRRVTVCYHRLKTGATLWCLSLCLLHSGGCGGEAAPQAEEGGQVAVPVAETAERGPVKMTVTANKGALTLAERLKLTVEVIAEEGVDVEMPRFGGRITDFTIHDFRETSEEPVDGGHRWRQEYDLDVFLSGEYTVPEFTAMFTDRRKGDGDVIEAGVTTDEFTVTVTSLVEGDFDPEQFADIKGPIALPVDRTWTWAWWTGGGLCAAVVAIVLLVMLVRRLRRAPPEIVIPAHEWAFDQLQGLIDEQLVEQGMVHEFYFRLSMIVRVYIERRFDLMAPEWTTEEFLVEVQRSLKLPIEYRGMLGGFLTACDMVKYALHEPGATEIEDVFNAARDFVDRSADRATGRAAA